MKAWVLDGISDLSVNEQPLRWADIPVPDAGDHEVRIRVSCCGVCHTELDEIEGRTPPETFPVVPGHQVVGVVETTGRGVTMHSVGDRVGVAWIFSACGSCEYCAKGLENLCLDFRATGRDANGGYAEYMVVNERFAYRIPETFDDVQAAPLLCAGAIGYRSLRLTGLSNGDCLGLTGFGASGHLVLKMAKHLLPDSSIVVWARSTEEQKFAISLGASWSGYTSESPPQKAHAIIDTTPAWKPVTDSLLHLKAGGRLVINAIRKESTDQQALLELRYADHLWMEKEIKSIANITRQDVVDFLRIASLVPIRPRVEVYAFEEANKALVDLKHKHVKGAKVLQITNT